MKIINGDCLIEMDRLIDEGIKVDISFTSPPYNRIRNDKYKNYDDNKSDYYEFLVNFTDKLLKLTKGYVIINIQQNHFNKSEVYRYFGNYHDKIIGNIIWNKTNPQPSTNFDKTNNDYSVTNAYEYFIILGNSEKLRSYNKNTKNILTTSVNSYKVEGHGAIMKYEVAEWFLKNFTKKNDLVLDCFMGTGTTGVACKKNDRNFIGIELDKKYFEISKERIEKITNIQQKTLF